MVLLYPKQLQVYLRTRPTTTVPVRPDPSNLCQLDKAYH